MSETTRRYTIDRRPRVQPGMSKADFDAAVYGRTFPALDGGTVTQGHADWCAKHGHATHKVDGELASMYCIRCGDPLPDAEAPADELAGMAAAVEGIDFSAAVEKAAALIASRSEREREAKLDELEREAMVKGAPYRIEQRRFGSLGGVLRYCITDEHGEVMQDAMGQLAMYRSMSTARRHLRTFLESAAEL